MVHRKTLSLPVEMLSMINTTKAYGATTKVVDKIVACTNKEKKSHGRSKSLFYQGHLSSSATTIKDTKKEIPQSMNYFDRAGLDCMSLTQVVSCSFDDESRDRVDSIDANDFFDRLTLQKDESTLKSKRSSDFTMDEFNHGNILTFDDKPPITACNLVSPKVTKRKILETTPIHTTEDTPTYQPSNPRKKMLTSEFNEKCPSFLACNKTPFNTFDLEGSDSFDSWDGPEDYSYDRDGNILRSFQLKPRSDRSTHIFENFPERLYLPNLCME